MAQRFLALIMLALAALGITDGWRLQQNERGQMLFDDIGPDRYLMGLGVLLAVLALWLLLPGTSEEPPTPAAADEAQHDAPKPGGTGVGAWMPAHALAVLALIGYAAALPWLGYVGATLLFMIVAFRIAGVAGWLRSAVFGAVATGMAYAIFIKGSDVPLPTGWLSNIIG